LLQHTNNVNVCILQHDILWETLTARQHMLFYGRLKNISDSQLQPAVREGLKQVKYAKVHHAAMQAVADLILSRYYDSIVRN
jgi:ABC-type multidrug transport system ATPase subunit